jgi:hypothetical protein
VSDARTSPIFKPCDTKRGADWSVLVTWPDEREQYLDGFQSFDETVAWVTDKSQAKGDRIARGDAFKDEQGPE